MVYGQNILLDDKSNEIIKVFHSKVGAGKRSYSEHHHTQCELSLFISGSGIYTVGDRSYDFSAGDMFLFGSDEPHCITDIYTEIDLINIHFEPRLLWEHRDNIELLNLFFSRNPDFSNKYPGSDLELKNYIHAVEYELTNKQTGYKTECRNKLFSALIYILRNYDYFDISKQYSKYRVAADNMKSAMNYINEHIDEKLTLKEIASAACMSQTYFSAVFKKLNGISPWDYIVIKRIEKAVYLIKTTDLTMLEISEQCGFSSSSNFYKAFAKITQKKPTDYLP